MFPGKFFLDEPAFAGLRETPNTSELQRFTKFCQAIHTILVWFEGLPALEAVKLTAIALVESQKIPFSVRIQHHFQLTTQGVSQVMAATEFALEYLPFEELGNGVFELTRTDPDVLEFLRMARSPEAAVDLGLAYRSLVLKLSIRMDESFEPCSVNHDVGIAVFK